MSRMTSARSITRTLSSRSRLAPCTGESSSSKITRDVSDEGGWIGCNNVLGDAAYNLGAGSIHEPGQLFEVFGNVPRVGRALAGSGYQHHALDRVADWNH